MPLRLGTLTNLLGPPNETQEFNTLSDLPLLPSTRPGAFILYNSLS